MELTILMPCLNEAQTLGNCIKSALSFLELAKIDGEVLIADNGSSDGSQQIAIDLGARVVPIPQKGYGSALIGGISSANGKFIIMGDSDESYDFSSLDAFVSSLRNGADLVMGNRFKGGIQKGAMPFLHKYLGNPVLSFIGRLFFSSSIGDFHCGLRGFRKASIEKLNLQCTGMEFASEMVVKATLLQLKIEEVPTILYPDGRNRPPHLKTWRDGWRHLRFLLMFSPIWLYLIPGTILFGVGCLMVLVLSFTTLEILGIRFEIHTLLFGYCFMYCGAQAVMAFFITRYLAIKNNFLPHRLPKIFEGNSIVDYSTFGGILLIVLGILGTWFSFFYWKNDGFGNLNPSITLRFVFPSVFAILMGVNAIIFGFLIGILNLRNQGSLT